MIDHRRVLEANLVTEQPAGARISVRTAQRDAPAFPGCTRIGWLVRLTARSGRLAITAIGFAALAEPGASRDGHALVPALTRPGVHLHPGRLGCLLHRRRDRREPAGCGCNRGRAFGSARPEPRGDRGEPVGERPRAYRGAELVLSWSRRQAGAAVDHPLGGETVTVTADPSAISWSFGDSGSTTGGSRASRIAQRPWRPGRSPHVYQTRCLPGDQGHDPYVLATSARTTATTSSRRRRGRSATPRLGL